MGTEREVAVTLDRDTVLQGKLVVPGGAVGLVVLTEGGGEGQQASRLAPLVAALREQGLATLRLDLLTAREEAGRRNRALCFPTGLLAMRLMRVSLWAHRTAGLRHLPVGYLGTGEGAEAALKALALDARCARAVLAWTEGSAPLMPGGPGVPVLRLGPSEGADGEGLVELALHAGGFFGKHLQPEEDLPAAAAH
jgi:hypothetical protein